MHGTNFAWFPDCCFAWNLFLQLGEDGEGTPVLVSMTASASLTRTQSMSPDCFISPSVTLKVPQSAISSRTDNISPSVSPSTSPTQMPPPMARPDTVSSFCRVSPTVSPSVSPLAPQPMSGLEVGPNLGKAGKVLGIPLTSTWSGGKRVPLADSNGTEVKEEFADGAEDQVII